MKKAIDRVTSVFARLAEEADTSELRGSLVADMTFLLAEVLSTVVTSELGECDCNYCRRTQGRSISTICEMLIDVTAKLINAKLDAKGIRSMYEPDVPSDINAELRKELLKELDT